MTLPSLATVGDLQDRLGESITDTAQADALLDYASALVRAYTGRTYVDDDGNLVDPLPDGVVQVTVEMVFRAVTNPSGVTQDTAGPFTVSFGADAAQRIYLTKADKTILGGTNQAFTIDTTPAASPVHELYGALVNGPYGWAPGET